MRILVLILLPVLLFVYIAMLSCDLIVMPHDKLTTIMQYRNWRSTVLYAFEWSAMLSMFYFGSLRKYKYQVLALIGFAFALLGKLFILQHWPFGRVILLTGGLSFIILYGLHFWKKKKTLFDVFKYCFIVIWVFAPIVKFSIRSHKFEVSLVYFIISITTFGMFYYYLWKNKPETRLPELEMEGDSIFTDYPNNKTI